MQVGSKSFSFDYVYGGSTLHMARYNFLFYLIELEHSKICFDTLLKICFDTLLKICFDTLLSLLCLCFLRRGRGSRTPWGLTVQGREVM